jgi:hypothetical protein
MGKNSCNSKIMTQIAHSNPQIFVYASMDVSNFAKRKTALKEFLKLYNNQIPKA